MREDSEVAAAGTEDFVKTFQMILDDLEKQSKRSPSKGFSKLKTAVGSGASSSSKHLEQLLAQRNSLESLLKLHKKVSEQQFRLCEPITSESLMDLCHHVSRIVRDSSKNSPSAQTLRKLLNSPTFSSLCAAYDDVSNRHYEPLLPEIPYEVDEDEGVALKIVRLVKKML